MESITTLHAFNVQQVLLLVQGDTGDIGTALPSLARMSSQQLDDHPKCNQARTASNLDCFVAHETCTTKGKLALERQNTQNTVMSICNAISRYVTRYHVTYRDIALHIAIHIDIVEKNTTYPYKSHSCASGYNSTCSSFFEQVV